MNFIITKYEVRSNEYHVIDSFVGLCWLDDLDYLTKLFYNYYDNAEKFQQHFNNSLRSCISADEMCYYVTVLFKCDIKHKFSLVGFSYKKKDSFIRTFIERCD